MSTIDQQFVEFVIKSIVSDPDSVSIERTIDEKGVLLKLTVNSEDLGRVIGKRGATAQSVRTLLRALGTKNEARYNLKIVDPEGDERRAQRRDDRDDSYPRRDDSPARDDRPASVESSDSPSSEAEATTPTEEAPVSEDSDDKSDGVSEAPAEEATEAPASEDNDTSEVADEVEAENEEKEEEKEEEKAEETSFADRHRADLDDLDDLDI